jgi:hypothetical protein
MKRIVIAIVAALLVAAPVVAAKPAPEPFAQTYSWSCAPKSSGQNWDGGGAVVIEQEFEACAEGGTFKALLYGAKHDALSLTVTAPDGTVLGTQVSVNRGSQTLWACGVGQIGTYTVAASADSDVHLTIAAGGHLSPCPG